MKRIIDGKTYDTETMEQITRVAAIKRFFESDGGRRVSIPEIKQLTKEDRAELAQLSAKELGVELN